MIPSQFVNRSFGVIAGVLLLAGCLQRGTPAAASMAMERRWDATLASALRAAEDGRYIDADRTLQEYYALDSTSTSGREVLFWRALLHLHPAKSGTAGDAAELLGRYLQRRDAPHRREAEVLRAIALALRDAPGPAADATAEAEKLRAELAKTQEELERIKRRLTQPRP